MPILDTMKDKIHRRRGSDSSSASEHAHSFDASRWHSHHFIGNLMHSHRRDPNHANCVPRADIRETKLAYHIELEVPGVTDRNKVLVQWLSPRSLIVEGEIERPDIGHLKPAEGTPMWASETPEMAEKKPPTGSAQPQERTWEDPSADIYEKEKKEEAIKAQSNETAEQKADLPSFLLSERHVGKWKRSFTLPIDVDMKGLRAKLEGGLLQIDLPRRDVSEHSTFKIEVV